MRIRRNLFISLFVFLCGVLTTAVGISFAWLSGATTEVNVEQLTGGVISQYFHCGTGTENDPFVITKPVHLYNLTELYTLEDSFADVGYYFQLGYDLENNGTLEFYDYDDNGKIIEGSYTNVLDMNYYENFRPIGSEENPFNGTFEGSNLTIDKLTISGEGVSDIGFFGYVSDSAKVQNLYIDNITIDTSEVEQNHHDHSNSYVGYVAGHIDNAACFENTYVNNCEIVGENSYIQNDWGYFGHCEDAATLEQFVQRAVEGEGQGNEWGGSIDMLALNKRIKYFLNKNLTAVAGGSSSSPKPIQTGYAVNANSNAYRYYVDDYQSYSTYSASTYGNNPATSQIIYRFVGGASSAYASTSSSSGKYNYYYEIPASYIPLLTASEDENYAVLEDNTGYIAGDLMRGSNTVRTASYANTYIGNSYANSELEVLSNSTVSYSVSNYKKIDNGHTNNLLPGYSADISADTYRGYSKAYGKICEVLGSASYVQGLHFTGSTISSASTTIIPKAYINGDLINNYATLRSSVDFYAKKNGSIKFFAGSYYNTVGTNSDSFFSLHTVSRSGNTVTPTQIYYVYANTNAATKKDYPHLYYNSNNQLIAGAYGNNVTKGDLEFDMRWLHNAPPVANAVYYFEIPVNAGEFALGSVGNATKGAYLMYLDIGTSGSQWEDVGVDDFTSIEYRSNPDTAEHSILLLTYVYTSNAELTIGVVYDDKKYYITASSNANLRLQVTVLNIADGYQYFVNGVEITNPEIKTYEYYV